ncbi:hypothetical protein [Spongiactinospora gelatinilytica]|uniref:hypothetical protein n=1 Tax=Spongiactinospora gelatinilytica TaxID=2666298 RepID=UPI001314BC86|nr:hypothetical protein [Spongiactinospora gelatinilytica]
MREAVARNKSGGTKVKTRRGEPGWHIPDPDNLRALHTEGAARVRHRLQLRSREQRSYL